MQNNICPWIANWVGLKNNRYFFTKLVWTVISFIVCFLIYGFVAADMIKNCWKTNVTNISMIICFVPIILSFIFFFIVFQRHIRYMCTSMTTLQELKMDHKHEAENPFSAKNTDLSIAVLSKNWSTFTLIYSGTFTKNERRHIQA